MISQDIFDDSGLTALPVTDRRGRSFLRSAPADPGRDAVAKVGTWVAEPGEYELVMGDSGETFVVVDGTGSMVVDGHGVHQLRPGSIALLPPHSRTTLTVEQTIRKLFVLPTTS